MNTGSALMQTLAWSLLHFLWQAAAIGALAAAMLATFRAPTTRYLLGLAALVMMCASFAATFVLLGAAPAHPAHASSAPFIATFSAVAIPDYPVTGSTEAVAAATGFAWIARLWLTGVCLLAVRMASGLLWLEHLRRRNLAGLPPRIVADCRRLQRRLGISRVVRYCECRLVAVPAVIGFIRPIVLLPVRALTGLSPEQLEAVIAHELGHVRRFDVAVNFFQVITETLFFFHPAVWWLNKRIRAAREDCCDDIAIGACGSRFDYARALATMEGWRGAPPLALAVTGGPVAARVARLLGVDEHPGTRNAGMFTATVVLAAALVAGAASLGYSEPTQAQSPVAGRGEAVPSPMTEPAPMSPLGPVSPPNPANPALAANPPPAANPPSPPGQVSVPDPAPRARRAAKPTPDPVPAPDARPSPARGSYIAQMQAAGYTDLDVDHLVAMRIHGVTPDFVRGMRDLGFEPDAGQLVAFRIHGVTPEYVRELRALGLSTNADEVIAMKLHGVSPAYRKALLDAGYDLTSRELVEAKLMGITPEFLAEAQARGFRKLTIRQLIQLKHADVL